MTAPASEFLFDDIKRYLPPYLSSEDKRLLFSELRRLREGQKVNYYWPNPDKTEALQGDLWRPLMIRNFDSGEPRDVTGIILSNSCDIDPNNGASRDQNVMFAPVRSLARYKDSLLRRGKSPESAEAIIADIRLQGGSDFFYLPPHGDALPESLITLDDVHSCPLGFFLERRQQRLATLSQVGHYILLLKISIHFTRLQEGVQRRMA